MGNFSIRKVGDIIEVKLRDESYNPFYVGQARINNKKEMRELINQLRQKGVTFNPGWFD